MKTTSVLGLSAALSISLALFGLSTAFADDKAPAALTGQSATNLAELVGTWQQRFKDLRRQILSDSFTWPRFVP